MDYAHMLLILCPLVFLASFVDSIAGGGGLISLPAFLLTGIPAHVACGSNKVSACTGSIVSAIRYHKNGKMHLKSAVVSGLLALTGAAVGAQINMLIDADLLKKLIVGILPVVAVLVLFGGKRVKTGKMLEGKRLYVTCAAIGFVIGMYDGLIGPGTGTFLIFAYTSLVGFDYVTASGNAKVANLASNLSSAVMYFLHGQVMLSLALPAAVCCIAGGWIGSGLAIQKGTKFIKVILVLVLIGIFGKLLYDLFA